jgi:hypothetical protein
MIRLFDIARARIARHRAKCFVKMNCPHVWNLLNRKAKRELPKGLQNFISGTDDVEGRRQLQLADSKIAALIAQTSEAIVCDAYRRDLSGLATEHNLAELLCELSLVAALGTISDARPVLRPRTETGKSCDFKIVVDGSDLFGEVKRLADPWQGGARSIAKSSPDSIPAYAARPRAMDLFSKLKAVEAQFPKGALNVLFIFHRSVWNSHVYIKQALFGDASGLGESNNPLLHNDGLFALSEWQEIAACAHSRVNADGSVSIVQIWRNPKACVLLTDGVRTRLAAVR